MVFFKSLLEALAVSALIFFLGTYAVSQGANVFTPAFFTLGGLFVVIAYVFFNFTIIKNWE